MSSVKRRPLTCSSCERAPRTYATSVSAGPPQWVGTGGSWSSPQPGAQWQRGCTAAKSESQGLAQVRGGRGGGIGRGSTSGATRAPCQARLARAAEELLERALHRTHGARRPAAAAAAARPARPAAHRLPEHRPQQLVQVDAVGAAHPWHPAHVHACAREAAHAGHPASEHLPEEVLRAHPARHAARPAAATAAALQPRLACATHAAATSAARTSPTPSQACACVCTDGVCMRGMVRTEPIIHLLLVGIGEHLPESAALVGERRRRIWACALHKRPQSP